ncbi:protein CLT1, chloroplastic isoform X2 [Cajanus cajan]|uniref:protein CLT1, chloroplastic isoform X2 n=1 Tax=Cajanus cajan TaxID=3821 RepID=UPI0010FB7B7D|nr:protein CLT1, chloroplastic isoform X2 [Cajanus cajan]
MRLVAVGSGVGGGPWVSSYVGGRNEKVGQCFYAVEDRKVAVDEGGDAVAGGGKRVAEVVVAAVATVVLGVGNRVLYKLALVPLKQYPFFLAQLATFGYVIVYFGILYIRHHAGIVTDEMLHAPKAPFIVVGILEALAAATGMAAGAILSGASIPILSQTFLVWQILLSIIFLGRRYKVNQLLGCFLVTIGVVVTVASGAGAGDSLKEGGDNLFGFNPKTEGRFYGPVCCQFIWICFPSRYPAIFHALFICLLLPFLSKLWGIPFGQLPNYLKDGAACFLNIGTLSSGCDGAPLLPLLFIIVNIGFNIALLHLLKISSAVVSCLASTFSVPISIYVFTMPLPYLGVASSLPTGFMAGAVILLVGLLIYAWTPSNGSSGASFSTST